MTVKTWVATHTGLPCVYSDQDVSVVVDGGRVLREAGTGVKTFTVSDALATPGKPTTYMIGNTKRTITRKETTMGTQVVTDINGRGIHGLGAYPLRAQPSWKSNATIHPTGAVRFPRHRPPMTGDTVFFLYDPTAEPNVWDILQGRTPVIIGTGSPVPGVTPIRPVIVTSVQSERLTPGGMKRFQVTWTEHTPRKGLSGAAPVVTWGEWEALGAGWQNRSYTDLCRLVAGMPA